MKIYWGVWSLVYLMFVYEFIFYSMLEKKQIENIIYC